MCVIYWLWSILMPTRCVKLLSMALVKKMFRVQIENFVIWRSYRRIFTQKLCRPIIALCTGLYQEGLIFTAINQRWCQATCTYGSRRKRVGKFLFFFKLAWIFMERRNNVSSYLAEIVWNICSGLWSKNINDISNMTILLVFMWHLSLLP